MALSTLPRGAIQQLGRLHLRHAGNVRRVAWSPRGDLIASVGFDETLTLWDAQTGAPLHRLGVSDPFVTALAFSPDGTRVVSGKKALRVWDTKTGKALLSLKGHKNTVNDVTYTPDGAQVVTASDDHTVRFFDATTGAESAKWTFEDGAMNVRVSADGQRVLVASEHALLVCARDGTRLASTPVTGSRDFVSADFSPDGAEIFAAGQDKRRLHRLRGPALESVDAIEVDHNLRAVAVSPDGRWLAFAGFGRYPAEPHPHQIPGRSVYSTHVYLWDIAAWKQVALLEGHIELVEGLCFSPDSTRLVSGSGDGTVRVWSVPEGKPVLTPGPGFEEEPRSAEFLSDNQVAVASSTETLVWAPREAKVLAEVRDGGHLDLACANAGVLGHAGRARECSPRARTEADRAHEPLIFALHWRRAERWSLTSDGATRRWSATETGEQLAAACASVDGRLLYAGDDKGNLLSWHAESGEPGPTRAITPKDPLTALDVSPDGAWLAVASVQRDKWYLVPTDPNGGEAREVALPDRGEKAAHRGHERQVASVAFAPDGRELFVATLIGNVEVFDVPSCAHARRLPTHAVGPVRGYSHSAGNNLVVSPDGRWLATSYRATGDRRAVIVATADGALLGAAKGASGPIEALALSPDAKLLVTVASRAREVLVWDVAKIAPATRGNTK